MNPKSVLILITVIAMPVLNASAIQGTGGQLHLAPATEAYQSRSGDGMTDLYGGGDEIPEKSKTEMIKRETAFVRERLSDSLLNLSDGLGQLITESHRQPEFGSRKISAPTIAESIQQDILQSREKLNDEFEATQRRIDEILREQAARRATSQMRIPGNDASLFDQGNTQNDSTGGDQRTLHPTQTDSNSTDDSSTGDSSTGESSTGDSSIDETIDAIKQKAAAVKTNSGIRFVNATAINKLALADNVFATGDVTTAGKLYSELLTESQNKRDQRWIKYQLAACYRSTKQFDEAERLLREITNENAEEFPTEQARWWLVMIEKRLVQESKLQAIENALQAMKKGSNNATDSE